MGYSAAEVVVKEVAEETGIEVEPVRLVAVLDGLRLGARGLPVLLPGVPLPGRGRGTATAPARSPAVGWFAEDALPEPLAGGGRWQHLAFSAIRGESFDVVFDYPRPSTWRS